MNCKSIYESLFNLLRDNSPKSYKKYLDKLIEAPADCRLLVLKKNIEFNKKYPRNDLNFELHSEILRDKIISSNEQNKIHQIEIVVKKID